AVRRAAMLAGADILLLLPVRLGGKPVGGLELLRAPEPFLDEERLAARVAAAQIELAVRSLAETGTRGLDRDGLLGLVGDALVVGADETGAAEQITRLAAEATGAIGALLWRLERGSGHVLVATHAVPVGAELGHAAAAVARAGGGRISVELDEVDGVRCAILQLGRPSAGALQPFFAPEASLDEARLARLATFGVRAAHALRANERAHTLAVELDQTRALLTVLGQAIAQLSLAHTLDTAVERIAELLGVERVAVYLSEDGRLTPAAGRGLGGPHLRVAERLFELILGPLRSRGVLAIEDAAGDPLLAPAATAVAETGIELALAVPLLVPEEAIGLLVVYPPAGRGISANESALLSAMGSQLAVAVQNARLHERAKSLGNELEAALASERQAAKRLRSLYEISRSFAQSLSLETTLQAVVSSVVELLGVDAAVIRMPDKRRELLEARAIHVADPALGPAIETILSRPQPFAILSTQRLFRSAGPVALDPEGAELLGAAHALLVPFLEKGSTAAVVPLATPAEVLGTLTILSLAPGRPIDDETVESAASLAGQAALAIDNARLYQQQKEFSDTMQRSLLPRSHPELDGLELGEVYESSAHVEVGGDVYD
ncbi:MAG: GAF domain-containing protein, partial [Gaiellaceae bacterium]